MIVYFSGNRTVLWYAKWAYQLDLTSTFVNRNSFATFLGLSLMADFALLARAFYLHVDGSSWRTVTRSSIECVFWHARVTTACIVAASSALLFTHSRGGVIASLLGGVALVLSMLVAPSLRGPWRWSFGLLAAVVPGILVALDGSGLLERVANVGIGSEFRFDINAGTLKAISDNFLFGTGLGTFKHVYAAYQPQAVGLLIDLAHNDYLENVLELGVPAATIFYLALLLLVLECVGGLLRRRRDAIVPCAAVAASVLVGSHSTVDFSMQMPAVAVIYAAFLGIGVAQSASSAARIGEHASATGPASR
jgi:O-antigen ligase